MKEYLWYQGEVGGLFGYWEHMLGPFLESYLEQMKDL